MTARRLLQLIGAGALMGAILILVMSMPVRDHVAEQKAAARAEARMKARIFTKFPDPALAAMSSPLSPHKERK